MCFDRAPLCGGRFPCARNALNSEFYHHFSYSISFSVKYHHRCYFLHVIFVQSEIIRVRIYTEHRVVVDVFLFLFSVPRSASSFELTKKYFKRQKKAHTHRIYFLQFFSSVEQTNKFHWEFGFDRWYYFRSARIKYALLIFYHRPIIWIQFSPLILIFIYKYRNAIESVRHVRSGDESAQWICKWIKLKQTPSVIEIDSSTQLAKFSFRSHSRWSKRIIKNTGSRQAVSFN